MKIPTSLVHLVRVLAVCAAAASTITACATDTAYRSTSMVQEVPRREVPQGIVLIVGDGMGAAHFTLARSLRGDRFEIGKLQQVGLVATASASSRVTDSAAAATAYATGVKTRNGYIGVDSSGAPQVTVVEAAEKRGLATGLVTTAKFGDATPAAFAAHVRDRHETLTIAEQMVGGGVDIIASTGLEWFGADGAPTLDELASRGDYLPVRTAAGLQSTGNSPVLAVLPSGELDGDSPEVPLRTLATWAINRLAHDPQGFFLLVEHEGTDTASHNASTAALRSSLRSLDATVGAVMAVARQRGDLLVIVVGDHETGGLQIGGTHGAPKHSWATGYHTGEAIPIFADGPGSAAFGRFQENTAVGMALLSLVREMGTQR